MKYGYFDDSVREYVITRPDTPSPWANYLGSPRYGAIITNQAGGYSFARSGAKGRILRYVFNEFDEPGRYIYLRDNEDGDYWSNTWQPVAKPLDTFKSEVRHGTAYTKICSVYRGIRTEALYYVPLDAEYEVWHVKVANDSDKKRSLTVTGFCEFTNNSFYENDQTNLQYSLFITRTHFVENRIRQTIHENQVVDGKPIEGTDNACEERFFGLSGAKVSSYCGDREGFLGRYHRYGDPAGVASGDLGNIDNWNENCCGALSTVISLEPGEEKEFTFTVGARQSKEAAEITARYEDPAAAAKELEELKTYWHGKLEHLMVKTPSDEFNSMVNTWNAFNCFMTFIWSRAASLIYNGLRNGYGYRDTVQDIQGVIHLAPEMAKEQIRFMLSAQVDNGGGLPLVKYTHNPGHEDTPDDASYVKETGHPAYRADDALWLFPTVYKYISETGDLAFLDEVIPFANRDEGDVYEHLKRALRFSEDHMGPHGLPAGLHADWNDCLRLGKNGESTFVAMQYYYACRLMTVFADYRGDAELKEKLAATMEDIRNKLQTLCYDTDRFTRGFVEDGRVIGKRDDPEANMWLNPQSWSVISGIAEGDQAGKVLDSVHDLLNTDYGVMLLAPYYHAHAFEGMLSLCYNPGCKENGGIFSQTQGWIILAESLMGHGDRAFTYYLENCPAAQNEDADTRVLEPYCYGQFTEGRDSEHFGRAHVHWLTGTASTMMVGCVEGILGLRPDPYGLRLAPAIPRCWNGFTMEKDFRGKHLCIKVENPGKAESGFVSMTVNGVSYADNYIPEKDLKDVNEVVLVIS